jgi:hypothetical protein
MGKTVGVALCKSSLLVAAPVKGRKGIYSRHAEVKGERE